MNLFKKAIASISIVSLLCVTFASCSISGDKPSESESIASTTTSSTHFTAEPLSSTDFSQEVTLTTSSTSTSTSATETSASGAEDDTTTADSSSTTTKKQTTTTKKQTTTTKKQTTTTTKAPSKPVVQISSSIEKALNSAPLKPMKTNDPEVDKLAEDILADITTPSMTTFQKVKAIHNYLVQTSSYESSGGGWNFDYISRYDGDVISLSKEMLRTQKGVCYNFAAVFMVLTRRIGLDSYMMSGYIDYNGGQSSHYWNIIRINGVEYLVDTQADWRNSQGGPTRYTNFCITNTTKYHYSNKEGTYAAFNNFERVPEQ